MKTFKPDIFPFNIAVASFKELNEIKKMFVDYLGNEIDISDGAAGVVVKAVTREQPKEAYSLIVFNGKPSISILAHEAFHSACDLLDRVGIEHVDGSSETYAYVIGYISECINTAIITDKIWE